MFKNGVLFLFGNEHGFNTKKCSVAMSFRIWNAQITPNRAKRGCNLLRQYVLCLEVITWQNQIR